MKSGQGELDEETGDMKWMASFEVPQFFEKKLHLKVGISEGGMTKEGEIVFHLDRDKAMKNTLKKNINQTIKVDGTKIHLESILASPTRTAITGTIQNILELAIDQLRDERIRPKNLSIKLIANGKYVPEQGAGMSTDMKGITFEYYFEPLPENIQSVQIEIDSISADYDVKEEVSLKKDMEKLNLEVLDQKIEINKLYQSQESTYVTITTDETTTLTRVYLMIDGKKVELKETITDDYSKLGDGRVLHTRTLNFPATGQDYKLEIERMTFLKSYNKIIDIPVNE
ncbi:hypothetical protein N752_07770 [Desulforamulus aquiferis]|nr:DUF5643 domain-containing protein [Desulforamulus aquiferis]RYD05782.1 hypothetical protein N752_07770 [Desulforamulus aquiferis]